MRALPQLWCDWGVSLTAHSLNPSVIHYCFVMGPVTPPPPPLVRPLHLYITLGLFLSLSCYINRFDLREEGGRCRQPCRYIWRLPSLACRHWGSAGPVRGSREMRHLEEPPCRVPPTPLKIALAIERMRED